MTITDPTLKRFAETALELQLLLNQTEDAQWQPSFSPVAREEREVRTKGMVQDPTANITVDPPRLALRTARETALGGLAQATDYLAYATRKLKAAEDFWLGDRPDAENAADPKNMAPLEVRR